ncbi:FAD-dependent oxidoreductase [bacterium]|nr:FAD-dependent oxidoreductase [bacterium]
MKTPGNDSSMLTAIVPDENYHRLLISCQAACPVHTDARGYVRAIAKGRFEEAYLIARGPNPFASICGRICGAPCEVACRRGKIPRTDADGLFEGWDRPIAIRALKRFACEAAGVEANGATRAWEQVSNYIPKIAADAEELATILRGSVDGSFVRANAEPIAIIGSGPAGLSAAHDLVLMGFRPVVFEVEANPAGMLMYGVPEYRLPRDLILQEVKVIQALGVEIRCGMRVGIHVKFSELRKDYAAVIIAVGAKRSRSLAIPGESGPHVYGGVDFLRSVFAGESLSLGGDVVVIGGGNVAYDVARTVVRQAAYDTARTAARLPGTRRVRLVSLETLEEMPADTVEIREGDEEGVERVGGYGPVQIIRDASGKLTGIEFKKCLRVYDEQRKFSPVFDENKRETLSCDTVLIAAGQTPDLSFLEDGGTDVKQFRPGWPQVDQQTLATTARGVFVAGDLAHGTRLMIDAIASGKKAARSVYEFLTGRKLEAARTTSFLTIRPYIRERGYEQIRRQEVPTLDSADRLKDPSAQVEQGFNRERAMKEASRCLDCGVTPVFDGNRCVLCGGCVDVCPTLCLKIVPLLQIQVSAGGPSQTGQPPSSSPLYKGGELLETDSSAILKDEDRCIRCALCVMRCPVDAIEMERVVFQTEWTTE